MTDLPRRLARGEPSAFSECYDAYADRLYRYLLVRLGRTHDAADVLQEVFARLVQHRSRLKKVENLTIYLFRMAHNEAARFLQRRLKHQAGTHESGHSREPDAAARAEAMDLALTAMNRLPAVNRDVVELKLFADCTFDEVARILRIPAGTAATRYRQALLELRRWVAQEKLL